MMSKNIMDLVLPAGEAAGDKLAVIGERFFLDTYGGKVQIERDPGAAVTPLGQLPFFVAFLNAGGGAG
jgi:hypothetical protein